MVRSLVSLLAILILFLVVVVFAWQNPGNIEIDLAFGAYEVPKAMAFSVAVAIGWLWGVISMLAYVFKLLAERRRLRKKVRLSEAELNNLRSLPMKDAG